MNMIAYSLLKAAGWRRRNKFWTKERQKSWPQGTTEFIFLGHAMLKIGETMFGDFDQEDFSFCPLVRIEERAIEIRTHVTEVNFWSAESPQRHSLQRARAAQDLFLSQSGAGKIKSFYRHHNGGDFHPIPHHNFDLVRSRHFFNDCTMATNAPFRQFYSVSDEYEIFVDRKSLELCLSKLKPNLPSSELRKFVAEHLTMGEEKFIILLKEEYNSYKIPGVPTIRIERKMQRDAAKITASRGRPKAG